MTGLLGLLRALRLQPITVSEARVVHVPAGDFEPGEEAIR